MKIMAKFYIVLNSIFNRQLLLIVIGFLIFTSIAFSQEISDFGKFYGDVRAPSAPAFTILGTNPSEISRPKSYRDVELSLLNNLFDQGSLTLPKNFSLEFSPFWMFEHPDLSFKELYRSSVLESALYNLSFSLATQTDESQAVNTTFLGAGVRTVFDFGRPRKTLELVHELGEMQRNMAFITNANTLIRTYILNQQQGFDGSKSAFKKLSSGLTESTEAVNNLPEDQKSFLNSMVKFFIAKVETSKIQDTAGLNSALNELLTGDQLESLLTEIKRDSKVVQAAIEDRVGFKLEVALALKRDYLDAQVSESRTSNSGFWLTPSYIHESLPIEFLGVVRYLHNNQDFVENGSTIDWTRNFDLGIKLVYKMKKFSLEGELIYREQTQVLEAITDLNGFSFRPKRTTADRKIDFTVAYQVDESISLSYTYGKNFELPILNGDLISGLNINFGIGGYKFKK